MMAKSHLTLGLASGATLSLAAPPEQIPFIIIAASIGSLFPDIDTTESTMGRAFIFLSFVLSSIFTHRGFTHSILFTAMLSGFGYFLYVNYFPAYFWVISAFVIGHISHIFGDLLTGGVYLFAPWDKRITIFSIRTNSFGEIVVAIFSSVLIALPFALHFA